MTLGILYIIFFMILLIASVILAILTTKELNKNESIELIGKKLENTDDIKSDFVNYLKIVNK